MSGYWLILATTPEDEAAQQAYAQLWRPIAEKYGARIELLDAGAALVETQGYARVLTVEFDSHERALACYRDQDYQVAKAFALKAARRELLILRGTPPRA